MLLGKAHKKELIAYAKNNNLKIATKLTEKDANLYLLGFKNNPYKYIKEESVFILTSYFEGMPNVIIEAMARGAIVMSTDCNTGPRELIAINRKFP